MAASTGKIANEWVRPVTYRFSPLVERQTDIKDISMVLKIVGVFQNILFAKDQCNIQFLLIVNGKKVKSWGFCTDNHMASGCYSVTTSLWSWPIDFISLYLNKKTNIFSVCLKNSIR